MMTIRQVKGSKRWPYQFRTGIGSTIKLQGPSAYEEAKKIAEHFGVKLRKWKP